MTNIKDLVPKDTSKGASIELMLTELQELNKIAVLKEDDNVVRGLLRGKSRKKILEDLRGKYPREVITINDLNEFIELYRDVLYQVKENTEKGYLRRLIQSQTGLSNNLTDLAIKAQALASKYDDEGDNKNAVAAIRAAADVFMKVGKLQGHFHEKPEVTVNMQMDKVVSQITTEDSDFKKSILRIIDEPEEQPIIDAEYKVNDGREKENLRDNSEIVHNGTKPEGSESNLREPIGRGEAPITGSTN